MKLSTKTFIDSTVQFVHMSLLYPPMPHTNIDHQYIPFDLLYPPRRQPSPPYQLGEDISGAGTGMCYIGIME